VPIEQLSKSGASRRRKERERETKGGRLLLSRPKGAAAVYCPTEWVLFVFVAVHLRIDFGKGIRRDREQASAPPAEHTLYIYIYTYKMLRRAIACNERVISGFNCWTDWGTVSLIFLSGILPCGSEASLKNRRMTSILHNMLCKWPRGEWVWFRGRPGRTMIAEDNRMKWAAKTFKFVYMSY